MSSSKTHSKGSSHHHHKGSSSGSGSKSEVVLAGPLYICENEGCHALVRIPPEKLHEEVINEKDDEGKEFSITELYFKCPACKERSVVDDFSDSETEEDPKEEKN